MFLLDLCVSIVVAGPLMIPIVLIYIYAGFSLQSYYMRVYREATRLQNITSSPIS